MYILTRFSVFQYPPAAFSIREKKMSESEYRNWLYGPSRMKEKFRAFEAVTLPSVKAQSYKNFEWLIYVSKTMPHGDLIRLFEDIQDIPQAKLIFVRSLDEVKDHVQEYTEEEVYTTVRLDDDDGLNPGYLKILSRYRKPGVVLNPKHGLLLDESLISAGPYSVPYCSAWGLALVGGNVFGLGDHTKIHERREVIDLEEPGLFLLHDNGPANASTHNRRKGVKMKPFDLGAFFDRAK